jgi:hypothetical protein
LPGGADYRNKYKNEAIPMTKHARQQPNDNQKRLVAIEDI